MPDRETNDPTWIRALSNFLSEASNAEAVLWDRDRTELQVATVGQVDERELRQKIEATIRAVQKSASAGAAEPGGPPSGFRVHSLPNQTLVEKDCACLTGATLWTWRQIPWPSVEEAAGVEDSEDWRVLAAFAAACGVFGIAGFVLEMSGFGPAWLAKALFVLSMIAGGWDAARDVIPKLPKGQLDIHFLMLAVAVGASFIGAFSEGALLLFLFSVAGALESFALFRTRREINALFRAAPKTARVRDPASGEESVVPVDGIARGDVVVIRPGDTFPVDGEVVSGETAADESSLTGEANPVAKRVGDKVFSGTMNLWGAIDARCERPASESSLQKIIDLIQRAQHLRAPSQRFTDRFGPGYTLAILGATAVMFFVWWLGFGVPPFLNETVGDETRFSSFYRAMTLLVVASPCALVLSIPSAILAAIAFGARNGILFRGGAAIEKLSEIDVAAMDKTGTLTTGDLDVVAVESFPPGREREVAELAFTLESRANHPIARAIVRYGKSEGLRELEVEEFRSITGKGVQASVGGGSCLLGRRELLLEGPLAGFVRDLPVPAPELSEVWFIRGDVVGRLLLRDRIRDESAAVLRELKDLGIHTVMLTGDRRETASAVAEELGVAEVRAGLTPEGKVEAVRAFTEAGRRVAMVGDGINDAPCLAAAHVSVAMGARGSDAALEQSEVILMNDRIENFLEAIRLSQRAKAIIRQNLVLALGTIAVMVSAAVFGIVPITVGVVAHEGSTVLVCLNSLRLLARRKRRG